MQILMALFLTFFKTGLLTFGGGYAMLPLLKDELVVKRKWIKQEELLNYFSIGQCTPGIIAVNVATFCGHKLYKTPGAIVATTAVVLPSVFMITLISLVFFDIKNAPSLKHILAGIQIGVVALLCKVVFDLCIKFYKQKNRIISFCVFALTLGSVLIFDISAVFVIAVLLALSTGFVVRKRFIK